MKRMPGVFLPLFGACPSLRDRQYRFELGNVYQTLADLGLDVARGGTAPLNKEEVNEQYVSLSVGFVGCEKYGLSFESRISENYALKLTCVNRHHFSPKTNE